ncbi:MAG TPA: homoserine kinase [Gemmatimonadales bacterium]|nr:homoserine kinase [Gemmatimonadales bacterium]
MSMMLKVRAQAFAPGSVGNLGPGLDILGLAVAGAGDEVAAERTEAGRITVRGAGHADLPTDPRRNTAALAAAEVLRRAGARSVGLSLTVRKGLPLCGGQGGSAASAVAGAVAVNHLLGGPLDRAALLEACVEAEAAVAGRHADNVAPSLLGGAVLIRSLHPLDVVRLPVPPELWVVLAHPDQRLRTRESRAVLPREVALDVALHQAAQVAAVVAALAAGDYALLGRALDDRVAEPARAPLLPGFDAAKRAAHAAGALGASISGSGPTAFALARGEASARAVGTAMQAAYAESGMTARIRVAEVDRSGARVVPGAGDG